MVDLIVKTFGKKIFRQGRIRRPTVTLRCVRTGLLPSGQKTAWVENEIKKLWRN